MNHRFIRLNEVKEKTGLQRTSIWKFIHEGKFPKSYKLSDDGRAVAWLESEIDEWIDNRIKEATK